MLSRTKLIIGGVGGGALLGFSILFTMIVGRFNFDAEEKLDFAMQLLDQQRWEMAERIAEELAEARQIDPDETAAWQYVMGVSKLQSVSDQLDSASHRRVLLDATKNLERASELGFPVGYRGKGRFYLGFCYFHTYRWAKVIEVLQDSVLVWPERRGDTFQLVFDAQTNAKPPRIAEARQTLDAWSSVPGLSSREQARIKVAEGRLALLNGLTATGEKLLAETPQGTALRAKADLLRALWRIEKAERQLQEERDRLGPGPAPELGEEIERILREVIVAAETPSDMRRQAVYLAGRNLRTQNRLREALGVFNGIRQRAPETAESIASAIEESEILFELNELDDVVSNTHHLLRNIEDLSLYNETWLSVAEMKTRILDIGRGLRRAGKYEKTLEFTKLIPLAFPATYAVRMQAETYRQWADHLASGPPGNTEQDRGLHRDLMRSKYRLAGETYEQLAQLELRSTEYPQILWEAVEAYQKGNDLEDANRLLKDYLRYEDRTKRPRGFLVLARNLMNAGEWQAALEPLQRCLESYPNSPVSYEARLLAGQAQKELNRLDEAIDTLASNLWDYELHPSSEIWQDSLFELGEAYYHRGEQTLLDIDLAKPQNWKETEAELESSHDDFMAAIQRLGEAISRYADDPRRFRAKYLIAEAYRMASRTPEKIADSSQTVMEPTRRLLILQRRDLLEKALKTYQEIASQINADSNRLGVYEQFDTILRNCYFDQADTLYELGRWEDAIEAYRNAASRFLNQPEALEAFARMAECQRKLGREDEAKRTIQQAKLVLDRIPAEYDPQFAKYTRATRQQWAKLLDWSQQWD